MATASPGGPARSRDGGSAASGPAPSRPEGAGKSYGRRDGVDAPHEVRASFLRGSLLTDRVADVSDFPEVPYRGAEAGSAPDPEIVAHLPARTRSPLGSLTPRKREVRALMAKGRSASAIAAALTPGAATAGKHTSSIFTKLGLTPGDTDHRRVLAVLRCLEAG
jgi:DNA-binding CsgD family transcriptional regulator